MHLILLILTFLAPVLKWGAEINNLPRPHRKSELNQDSNQDFSHSRTCATNLEPKHSISQDYDLIKVESNAYLLSTFNVYMWSAILVWCPYSNTTTTAVFLRCIFPFVFGCSPVTHEIGTRSKKQIRGNWCRVLCPALTSENTLFT